MQEVPNLRGGTLGTLAFILGPLLGAVMVVGGLVWMAAKYPERSEFDAVKAKIENTALDTAVYKVRLDSVQSRLDTIDVKLDRLLEQNRQRLRR